MDASDLVRMLDVAEVADGHFVAPAQLAPPAGAGVDHRDVVEGGQLLGDLIVAASKVDPSKRVTSAYAVFLKAAFLDESIDIATEVLRRGRSITTIEGRLSQSGDVRSVGMAMLDAGGDDVLRSVAPMPDVAGPDASPPLEVSMPGRELREVDGCYLANRDVVGPPEVYIWARYHEAPTEQYLQQAVVAQLTTHWTVGAAMRPKDGLTEADAHRTVSTGPLAVSIAFHDEIDVTDWMLYCNPVIHAGRGSVQGDGRVHSIDGRLLASYTVQAMVRSFTVSPESVGGAQRAM